MGFGGYAGNILHVNLNDGSVRKQPLDSETITTYIGGAGINTRLAIDLIPPDTDPLSPRNAVILGTGPFNGTFIPGAAQTMSIYRSPLNGAFPQSNGSGNFSHFLKSSGYDHLVITGRSPWPVYLLIKDDDIQLKHASDIWGGDTYDTTDELRLRHSPCSILPIGPAGEQQVAVSMTQIDKSGAIGSGGLAAVMGSKNLKAIVACAGSRPLEVADPERLHRLVDGLLDRINSYKPGTEMMKCGDMWMPPEGMPPGILARNSTELIPYPAGMEELKAQIYDLHKASRREIACAACPLSDLYRVDLPGGGTFYDMADFMEIAAFTSDGALGFINENAAAHKYRLAIQYYDETNRLGLDRLYSFHGLADFIITLYEEGLITTADTGGMELNRSYDTLLKLARMISMREGIGNILADGVVSAADKLRMDEHVQNVIKGQFVTSDPRLGGFLPLHFGQMVHPGRALGVSATMGAPSYSPAWPVADIKEQAARCGMSAWDIERLFTGEELNIGRMSKHGEDFFGLFNMLGQCNSLHISRFFSLSMLAELYSAVTGIASTGDDLKRASADSWKMWRELNQKAGFSKEDDLPPDIWFKPLKSPARDYEVYDYFLNRKLSRDDVLGYLQDYYAEREL